ncbi:MAG TPA: M56 family metallopeptidase [Tepidisphaeraceae bacterium]|jgi:beta-lactamase regulating signal transducer with metallopeptidase domain|nr:M56 family metallopeptidase [Tepidisphaeraceae bacterium]
MSLAQTIGHLSAAAPAALPVLVDAAVKSAAILAATALATFAMRRASAAARHLAWLLGLASLLVLPILSAALPAWHVLPAWAMPTANTTASAASIPSLPPSSPSPHQGEGGVRVRAMPEIPGPDALVQGAPPTAPADRAPRRPATLDDQVPPRPAASPIHIPWQAWVILAWAAGYALLLAHILLGLASLRQVRRRSHRITDAGSLALLHDLSAHLNLRRQVELLASPHRAMPMIWGIFRIHLLLPADAAKWPPDHRRAVLLHELAHAKRGDTVWQPLAQFIRALYWFNPLVWLACRRLQAEREMACDDLVLSGGARPSAYAEQLLQIAAEMPAPRSATAAIAMARPSALEGRLLAILDAGRNRKNVTAATVIAALLAAAAITAAVAILHGAAPNPVSASVTLFADSAGNPMLQKFPPVEIDKPADVAGLSAFFPQLGKTSGSAAGWPAGAQIVFRFPDGQTTTVVASASDEFGLWTEGRGDWNVHGDLAAYLDKLRPASPAADPALDKLRDAAATAGLRAIEARTNYDAALQAKDDPQKLRGMAGPDLVAKLDPQGQTFRAQLTDIQLQLDLLAKKGYLDNSPIVVQDQALADELRDQIGAADKQFARAYLQELPSKKQDAAKAYTDWLKTIATPPVAAGNGSPMEETPHAGPAATQSSVAPAEDAVYAAKLAAATRHFQLVEREHNAGIADELEYLRAKGDLQILQAEQTGDAIKIAEARLAVAERIFKLVKAEANAGLATATQLDDAQGDVEIRQAELKAQRGKSALATQPATAPAATAPSKALARVAITSDRDEYLLGENIMVTYRVENIGSKNLRYEPGGFYPDLRLNDGYRTKASLVDDLGNPLPGNVEQASWPENFGGRLGDWELKPGQSHAQTLYLDRYLRFVEPGRYLIRISNVDRLDPARVYSAGGITIRLKAPTAEEARQIFLRMKSLPSGPVAGISEVRDKAVSDFEGLLNPVYLPILVEYAGKGDGDALTALGKMRTPGSVAALVDLIKQFLRDEKADLAMSALMQMRDSLPDPRMFERGYGDYYKEKRQYMQGTWKRAYAPTIRELAARWARAKEPKYLEEVSFVYECIGTAGDLPDLMLAYTKSIEATKTLPFETNQYFRPRGSAYGFFFSTDQLLARGAKPPINPATPGEAAVYFDALQQDKDFRPKDWVDQAVQWLGYPTPYLRELVLDHVPEPVPKPILDLLPKMLADDYPDLQIAACHVATKNPRVAFRAPILKILETEKEVHLLDAAQEAAAANGIPKDQVTHALSAKRPKSNP